MEENYKKVTSSCYERVGSGEGAGCWAVRGWGRALTTSDVSRKFTILAKGLPREGGREGRAVRADITVLPLNTSTSVPAFHLLIALLIHFAPFLFIFPLKKEGGFRM